MDSNNEIEEKDNLVSDENREKTPTPKTLSGFWKGLVLGIVVAFAIVGLALAGLRLLGGNSGSVVSSDTQKKLSKIQRIVKEKFLYEEDSDALQDGILKGYVDGLDDVYSVYYDEEETKALQESTSGEYSGVGAVLTEDATTGVVTIVEVYEDSPAEKAGLKAEDILYKVDDTEVTGMDLSKVVSYIKGDEGTDVTLTVIRGDQSDGTQSTPSPTTSKATPPGYSSWSRRRPTKPSKYRQQWRSPASRAGRGVPRAEPSCSSELPGRRPAGRRRGRSRRGSRSESSRSGCCRVWDPNR